MARNLRVAGGECDLIVDERGGRVVVEVKTVTGGDPFVRVDDNKDRMLGRIARTVGAIRIDVVGVVVGPTHAAIHASHGW